MKILFFLTLIWVQSSTANQLKEGFYELELNSNKVSFKKVRLFLVRKNNYPVYKNVREFLPFPVSASRGDRFQFIESYPLVEKKNKSGKTLLVLKAKRATKEKISFLFDAGLKKGSLFHLRKTSQQKEGLFKVTQFRSMEKIQLQSLNYMATSQSDLKSLKQKCDDGKFIGDAQFLEIPYLMTGKHTGWIMGLAIRKSQCALFIASTILGEKKQNVSKAYLGELVQRTYKNVIGNEKDMTEDRIPYLMMKAESVSSKHASLGFQFHEDYVGSPLFTVSLRKIAHPDY